MMERRLYQKTDTYDFGYATLKNIFIPRADLYVVGFNQDNPDLKARLWCPNPERARYAYYIQGRLTRPSERFVHLLGYKPAPQATGRRETRGDNLNFTGEGNDDVVRLPTMVHFLTDQDKEKMGYLASRIFEDEVCRPLLWVSPSARGVSQIEIYPQYPQDETRAILYKFFPNRNYVWP